MHCQHPTGPRRCPPARLPQPSPFRHSPFRPLPLSPTASIHPHAARGCSRSLPQPHGGPSRLRPPPHSPTASTEVPSSSAPHGPSGPTSPGHSLRLGLSPAPVQLTPQPPPPPPRVGPSATKRGPIGPALTCAPREGGRAGSWGRAAPGGGGAGHGPAAAAGGAAPTALRSTGTRRR